MKTEEPESMKEIREIRKKIYEKIKDMTPEERISYFKMKSDVAIKKHGLKLKVMSKSK